VEASRGEVIRKIPYKTLNKEIITADKMAKVK